LEEETTPEDELLTTEGGADRREEGIVRLVF